MCLAFFILSGVAVAADTFPFNRFGCMIGFQKRGESFRGDLDMCVKRLLTFLGALLIAGSAAGGVDPTDKCAAAKIKEAGKYSKCLLNEESKAIKKGLPGDVSKCDSKLTKKWTKIEEKGGQACPTLGDEMPLKSRVSGDADAIIAGLWGGTAPIGEGKIHTEYDLFSIELNDPRTISVEAVDATGDPVTFTAAAEDGSCATVSADPNSNSVTVTGVEEHCDETITITSDTGITKTLTIKVYDPMVMDIGGGLLIKYVNDFECRWTPAGTDGSHAGEFYHPVTEAGWYPLGSKIIDEYVLHVPPYNDPRGQVIALLLEPVIVVKELDPNASTPALAAPTGYEWIWDSVGTGASWPGSVWKPVCPGGYVPLGVVTNGLLSEPSTEDMRCVRDDYTTEANIGEWVYDAHGMGGYDPLIVHENGAPKRPDLDGAPLNVGTQIGCPGWVLSDCDQNLFRLLLVPIEPVERSDRVGYELTIDQDGNIPPGGHFLYASSARIPFTLIPMLDCEHPFGQSYCESNVENYPFYRLRRADQYTTVINVYNGSETLQTPSKVLVYSWEQARIESFSTELGISLTAGGSAKFLGSGVSWEVTVSATFGWDTTVSESYGRVEQLSIPVNVPPNTRVVVAQAEARLWAQSEVDGGPNLVQVLGEENGFSQGEHLYYIQYPPPFE
jgi:hypothetical protein